MEQRLHLVLPKTNIETFGKPAFFLAGPIKGGDDWQKRAIKLLYERQSKSFIFCPCRYGPDHELFNDSVAQWMPQGSSGHHRSQIHESQTLWERQYLETASKDGCIIFWLPEESKVNPRNDGSPYARDTYGELGEWRVRSAGEQNWLVSRPKVVIGAEPGFPGLKQIKTNFQAMIPGFVIHESLEATIDAAIKVARI